MAKLWSGSRRVRGLGLLLAVIVGAGFLAGQLAEARPGGGQNYRSAPTHTYSPPSHTYSDPSPSYSAPSHTYSAPTPVYIPSNPGYSNSRSDYGSSRSGCGGLGWVVVLIIIIALVVIYYSGQRGKQQNQRAHITADRATVEKGLAALRSQDPEFDPQAFLERTRTVVSKVNETWLKGDMGAARRVISDGVYVRFGTQLALLKADGLRNAMAEWRIVTTEVLAAESDPLWDTIHVKVACAARDSDVPLNLSDAQTSKRLRSAALEEYHEVWSFVRRRGKQSKKGVPALEGRCPNCGADMPLSQVVKCEYCKALVNSGEHDWVLAEITQPEEWRAGATTDSLEGLDSLRERDPAVSRQELEDRASVVFWKWIEARSTGKPDKLARFCVKPPKDAGSAARVALGPTAVKLRQVAVGSAELKSVTQAKDADKQMDQAVIELRWSASVDGAEPAFDIHEFVLARKADAVSKRGMSSLDCPVCGGQLAASDATTCSYCGETLFGGKHEWALIGVRRGELPPDNGSDADPEPPEGEDDGSSKADTAMAALGVGLAIVGAIADSSNDDD